MPNFPQPQLAPRLQTVPGKCRAPTRTIAGHTVAMRVSIRAHGQSNQLCAHVCHKKRGPTVRFMRTSALDAGSRALACEFVGKNARRIWVYWSSPDPLHHIDMSSFVPACSWPLFVKRVKCTEGSNSRVLECEPGFEPSDGWATCNGIVVRAIWLLPGFALWLSFQNCRRKVWDYGFDQVNFCKGWNHILKVVKILVFGSPVLLFLDWLRRWWGITVWNLELLSRNFIQ